MCSSFGQQSSNTIGYLISLRKQLICRELCNNSPQNLVTNSWQNLILIIFSNIVMDNIKFINLRVEKYPNRNPNSLHISISSLTFNFSLSSLNIIDDRFLNKRKPKIITLTISNWRQSSKFIKLDRIVPYINYLYMNELPQQIELSKPQPSTPAKIRPNLNLPLILMLLGLNDEAVLLKFLNPLEFIKNNNGLQTFFDIFRYQAYQQKYFNLKHYLRIDRQIIFIDWYLQKNLNQLYFSYFQVYLQIDFIIIQKSIMIQSATFSMQESENILKTFLIDYDMSKVIEKFVKREPIHLREHLKRIIRETIINIEAHLFKAQKIPSLLLYDNQSDQMFEAFLNLKDIIPDSQKDNFYLNFVNMKSEGCRIMRFGRTDYHVSINSQQRQRIYARFISYTEHHSLYKFAITRKDDDCALQNPPYSDPCKLFSQRDLEFVFKTYCMQKGDIVKMSQYFKFKGVQDPRFEIQSLEQSIPNLMLIGYYIAHKRSAEANATQPIRWSQFRQKYPLPQQCDFKAKVIWIRIAIRNDPEPSELKWIHKIQKKKIVIKTPKIQPPKKGSNYDHKKWRKGKESVMFRIKQQIKTSLIDGKQRSSYDDQSVRSHSQSHRSINMSNRNSQKIQRSQRQKPQQVPPAPHNDEDQDQFQEDKLSKKEKEPGFIKKIQQQSESQRINEQRNEDEVVWQEIPDKNNNSAQIQHHESSANQSINFYSEKPILSKISKQKSARSLGNRNNKPKQVEHKKKRRNGQEQMSGQEQNYQDYELEGDSNEYNDVQEDNQYESD